MQIKLLVGIGKIVTTTFFVPLLAVCLFLFFKDMEFSFNKFINRIAVCTFGVYLLHESPFIRPLIWGRVFDVYSLYQSKWFPAVSALIAIVVFVA